MWKGHSLLADKIFLICIFYSFRESHFPFIGLSLRANYYCQSIIEKIKTIEKS